MPKSLSQLLNESTEREPCLIEPDVLPFAGKGFFYGFAGIGKSFLMMQLMFEAANGVPWLGAFEMSRPVRVLYLQCELPEGKFRDRMRVMAKGYPDTPDDLLWTHTTRSMKIVPGDEEFGELVRWMERYKPALWIIDPEYKVFRGDENQTKDVGPFVDLLDVVSERLNCAVMLVSHRRKKQRDDMGQGVDRTFEEMPGSQRKSAWADMIMRMEKTQKGKRVVFEKTRYGEAPEEMWLTLDERTMKHIAGNSSQLEQVMAAELKHGPQSLATLRELLLDMDFADITVRRSLEKMEREGTVVIEPMPGDKRQRVVRLR